MSVTCNYHNIDLPQIVYAKNSNGKRCCGGGIFSGLFSGRGCGGNRLVNGLITGGILTGAAILFNKAFNKGGFFSGMLDCLGGGSWMGGATSFLGGMGGYCGVPTSMAEFATLFACSPLGQLQATIAEEDALAKLTEELKPLVDKAIEDSGLEIEKGSVEYKDVLAKAGAIKTAKPEISDDELKTRLKNYAIASDYDDKLIDLATEKINTITMSDGTSDEEIKDDYLTLGKGYVQLMDGDCNGEVSASEFIKHEVAILGKDIDAEDKKKAEKQSNAIFALLDTNQDNKLDAEEFAAYHHMQATYTDTETDTANDLTAAENETYANAQLAAVNNLLNEESQGVEAAEFREKYEEHLALFKEET